MNHLKPYLKPIAIVCFSSAAVGAVSQPVQAKTYLTIEQAKKVLAPGGSLVQIHLDIPKDVLTAMRKMSKISYPFYADNIWRTSSKEWFIVDEVVGKHEMIQYAARISESGQVQGVEVLAYNESYGHEIMQQEWRNQFIGKSINDAILLNSDIHNISGATLSCKHLTEGVKRLVVLHNLYLKKLP